MKNHIRGLLFILATIAICNLQPSQARAQGTAFLYSGEFNDVNGPANGIYDLTFTLFAPTQAVYTLPGR